MELTELERQALDLFALFYAEAHKSIILHLVDVKVVSRENTGDGFFTVLAIDRTTTPPADCPSPLGGFEITNIGGISLEFLLHFKEGYADILEGYSPQGENTSLIDFEAPPFDRAGQGGEQPESTA